MIRLLTLPLRLAVTPFIIILAASVIASMCSGSFRQGLSYVLFGPSKP